MKRCPICINDLEIEDFGVCRARSDGRNLYCKKCIREKVSAGRKMIRAYKAMRQQRIERVLAEPPAWISPSNLTPVEKVLAAIQSNARTQQEIATETKLDYEVIGEALVKLLLWTGEIRTEVVDGSRMYFINEPVEVSAVEKSVRRKPDVPSSFSSIEGLMPGRKVEKKIGGRKAA